MTEKPLDVNFSDHEDRPEGGVSTGVGFTISWQRGPCPEPKDRNGAFLIEVLESCAVRLGFYQSSAFSCVENEQALGHLQDAINLLKARRDRRRAAGILGSHEKD